MGPDAQRRADFEAAAMATVDAFWSRLMSGDAAGAYELLSARDRLAIQPEAWSGAARQPLPHGPSLRHQVRVLEATDDEVVVELYAEFEAEPPLEFPYRVIREGDGWRLDLGLAAEQEA